MKKKKITKKPFKSHIKTKDELRRERFAEVYEKVQARLKYIEAKKIRKHR